MKAKNTVFENFKLITISLLILLVGLISVDKMTTRIPLILNEAVLDVTENNGVVQVKFKEEVAGFEKVFYDTDKKTYNILAWQTPYSKMLESNTNKSTKIDFKAESIDSIYYTGVKSELDTIIYGDVSSENITTLPRLAMNYYIILAIAFSVLFSVLRFFFKNNEKITNYSTIGWFISVAYIISHSLVMMTRSTTYFINRDLSFVLIETVVLAIIFILYYFKTLQKTDLWKKLLA